MTTRTDHRATSVGTRTKVVREDVRRREGTSLTTAQVWRALDKGSFAVVGYATPEGQPRSSGVMYKTVGRRMYVVVAPDGWKAKHIAASGRVAVTVPVRRGGILSLVAPIPPATISFHATATVHQAGSRKLASLAKELASMLPAERRASSCLIEIVPEGEFVTYAVGVPLRQMRDTVLARGRASVS